MSTQLQRLTTADAPALKAMSITTFTATFGAQNTAENLQAYLTQAYTLPKLTQELQNPDSQFYFLIQDQQPVGYLKVNVGNAQSEAMGPTTLEIERIYIIPGHQHQGLGSQLLQYALDLAQAAHKQVVWLGVWEHNEPAKRFYQAHWGFTPFSSHAFVMGTDTQTDLLMHKQL